MQNNWTESEINLLKSNYKDKSKEEMLELLPNKNALEIRTKAKKLGVKKNNYFRLTDKQKLRINEIYANTRTEDIAIELRCTNYCIYRYAHVNGLRKNPEFIKSNAKANFTQDHPGRKTVFKNKNVPFNEGKKQIEYMSPEAIERTKATRFKPGQEIWNRKPIGYERVDKYGYIRIKTEEPNGFRYKHHVEYEKHYGPIPKGYNVQFRNRIRTDCTPENLYLISRRDQLLNENGIMAIPEELKPTYAALRTLRKTIKKHEQKQKSN